jgi:hypothetical protein
MGTTLLLSSVVRTLLAIGLAPTKELACQRVLDAVQRLAIALGIDRQAFSTPREPFSAPREPFSAPRRQRMKRRG